MKPDGVSQEAWDAAERLELRLVQSRSNEEVMDCIARAIMAAKAEEREACAEQLIEIAKASPMGHESQQRGKCTYNWLAYCADLIRKRREA